MVNLEFLQQQRILDVPPEAVAVWPLDVPTSVSEGRRDGGRRNLLAAAAPGEDPDGCLGGAGSAGRWARGGGAVEPSVCRNLVAAAPTLIPPASAEGSGPGLDALSSASGGGSGGPRGGIGSSAGAGVVVASGRGSGPEVRQRV